MREKKTAVMIGAGPAGLTAALEFARRSEIHPIVLEASREIGGISRTIRHNGNRMDIGGHRFFSKSDRVMDWWAALMPITGDGEHSVRYQNKERVVAATAEDSDLVMLVRPRRSRIYFLRNFFNYPLSLDARTLRLLGLKRTFKIGLGYLRAKLFPRKPEKTLEDFLINRFGKELYRTFFESYTEKVWGVPCTVSTPRGARSGSRVCPCQRRCSHYLKKFQWPRSRRHSSERNRDVADREISVPEDRSWTDVAGSGSTG